MPELPPTVTEWPAAKVRDTFISFFEAKEHVNWVSSPVVPLNDPTLLFANAGSFLFYLFLSISVWLLGKLFGKVINVKVLDPFFIYIFCFCLCFVLGLLNYTQNWLLREDGKALKKMKIVGSFLFFLCS